MPHNLRSTRWRILINLGIIAAIFAPRLFYLDSFSIQDEHLWINRAQIYSTAIQHNDLEAAVAFELQNHPAITLLSVVGPTMQLYGSFHDLQGLYESWSIDHRRAAATWARFALGLTASLALTALYVIARKLRFFSGQPYAAAAIVILLGLEPWIWGVTRTVIVDTLMALFLVLSIVTGALARERREYKWVALAGAWWALAFVSKSPALILLPAALLFPVLLQPQQWREVLTRTVAWLFGSYVTLITVWPPFFLHPIARLRGVLARVDYHTSLTEAYLWPGLHMPLFLFVLSTFATVGCVLYVALRLKSWRREKLNLLAFDVVLCSGIFFGLVLVYLQGDHVRKNVPVLALLATAGAMGWVLLLRHLRVNSFVSLAGLVLVQLALVYPWFPHLPSYHNFLFPSAEGKRLLVDVGNGSRLIADYINWQDEPITAATNLPGLVAPYVRDDRRGNIRRLPKTLAEASADTTHLIVPESYPARVSFDSSAQSLLADLKNMAPETVLSVRDVPLFSVYRIEPKSKD